MLSFKEFNDEVVTEAVDENNFSTYSAAVQHALTKIAKAKLTYNEDEYHSVVATGSKKPGIGKTTTWKLPLYKADGITATKKVLVVNVYGKENGKYELNAYVS